MFHGQTQNAEQFPEITEDIFQGMDKGIVLKQNEIAGRNTWNIWCGGTEIFWDRMARESQGLVDLLKTIDSRKRARRFQEFGLINQPGLRAATAPDKFGLWIDEILLPERGSIDRKIYGRPTGILGFRLFDNPDFQGEAVRRWDASRFYSDAQYSRQKDLVRPYRVGVACGACHIAFNPCHPPADPENPAWEDLSSTVGNQFIREGRVFAAPLQQGSFVWEMLEAQPPGTSDTSRIATDHINNPGAINAIFELPSRLAIAAPEHLSKPSRFLPGTLPTARVPCLLKDGADSVGIQGAILRVYVNIGMASEYWLQCHDVLLGRFSQRPFDVEAARRTSPFWRATEQKVPNLVSFLLKMTSFRLSDAPDGDRFVTHDQEVLTRGRILFAENCAHCHSSKRPPRGFDEEKWFREQVLATDFWRGNFFADERRHPVTKIRSNAARSFASNAQQGHVWQNFSSDNYKALASPGSISVWNPFEDRPTDLPIPGNGTGYYRTPSLLSVWSSAPFLHNNSLGEFNGDPSVRGRLAAFEDAAQKLLLLKPRRDKDSVWRTAHECSIRIPAQNIPAAMRTTLDPLLDPNGTLVIGPIPPGTPINLLANADLTRDPALLAEVSSKVILALRQIQNKQSDANEVQRLMRDIIGPALLSINSCPDFVEDRGHYFGTNLSDSDKRALIELLKTL